MKASPSAPPERNPDIRVDVSLLGRRVERQENDSSLSQCPAVQSHPCSCTTSRTSIGGTQQGGTKLSMNTRGSNTEDIFDVGRSARVSSVP